MNFEIDSSSTLQSALKSNYYNNISSCPVDITPTEKGASSSNEYIEQSDSSLTTEIVDQAVISPEGIKAYNNEQEDSSCNQESFEDSSGELTEEEQEEVEELEQRDEEVRKHEQQHQSAAGDLAISGATFEYENGPDGERYVVSGEVQIDVKDGDTPEETIELAQKVKKAALAPEDPSSQDRKVAAEADAKIAKAQKEINEQEAQYESGMSEEEMLGVLVDTAA